MAGVRETLLDLKDQTEREYRTKMADIMKALAALDAPPVTLRERVRAFGGNTATEDLIAPAGDARSISDYIVEAVEAGYGTPLQVGQYLQSVHVKTTNHSINTRLSKLKADGRIGHDGERWVPVKNKAPETQASGA